MAAVKPPARRSESLRVDHLGVAKVPVAPQTTIADPTGGATIDAQSRTAIGAIIDALQAFGLVL